MRQEINLLIGDAYSNGYRLSSIHSLWIVAGLCVVFIFYIYIKYTSLSDLKQAVLETQNNIDAIEIKPVDNTRLVNDKQQVSRLENNLEKKKNLLVQYSKISTAGRKGFSEYFDIMGKSFNKNLSIEHIKVFNGGKNLIFSGYSINPQSVPDYINTLKKHELLVNVKFGELLIERHSQSELMKFSLQDESLDSFSSSNAGS